MANSDYKVAFIGLPSSGKSTIINSLIGKRLLESGICRTTTEYKLLEEYIEDDNNNKFKVIDLPGICDSEESNTNFNELTNEHIKDANLIIWTSDVNKAFITTHEVNEYNRIKEYIKNLNNDTGKLYYLIICLSKCDKDISDKKSKTKKSRQSNEEISESDEDTDLVDMINKVKEKFPNEDIIHFNAFGRSYHNKRSSSILKKFITKYGMQSKNNIKFDITKYIKNYDKDQETEYLNNFKYKYQIFLNNQLDIDKLFVIYNKLIVVNKFNYLKNICTEPFNTNLRIFQFIQYIINKIILPDTHLIIYPVYTRVIDYYLYILYNLYNPNLPNIEYNWIKKYSKDQIINEIILHYNKISTIHQIDLYNKLLFNYTEFKCHICDRIPIIKRIHEKYNCNMYNFDFKNNFNKYIKSPSYLINFKDFYDIIKNTSQIKQYKLEFNNNQTSKEIFNNYLKLLEDINNDNNYILLNKLEIINNISNNKYDDNNCSFIQLLNSFTYIPLSRLINNLEWSEIYESIWNKIYSNIEVDFNYGRDYIKDFKPVNRFELLYK